MNITNFSVDRPCCAMQAGIVVLIFLSLFVVTGEYYLVDDGNSGREYLIWNDPIVLDYTKWQAASQYAIDNAPFKVEYERSEPGTPSYIMYTNLKGSQPYGLLNKDTLLKIQKLEKMILDNPRFKDICLAETSLDKSCSKEKSFHTPLSALEKAGIDDIDATDQDVILDKLKTLMENEEVWTKEKIYFDKYLSRDNMTASYMRAVFPPGLPLEGYAN